MEEKDLLQIKNLGISEDKLNSQLEAFKAGFPYLDVISPATEEKGITVLDEADRALALRTLEESGAKVTKFVPASGAASRMFKDLFKGLEIAEKGEALPAGSPAENFCRHISCFAFYDDAMFAGKTDREILSATLKEDGLGYGSKSKGQVSFHRYADCSRTAFEEHLVEGALYARDAGGKVNLIYSVSAEHLDAYKALYERVKPKYEALFGVSYDVRFTLQSKSTDTVAVNEDNTPFRKADGSLLFRPGGHGALIENVNEISSDVIVIKNIDNVIHQSGIEQTVLWKKLLAGRLLYLRGRVFDYLHRIDEGCDDSEFIWEMVNFLDKEFCVTFSEPDFSSSKRRMLSRIHAKLNRPVRVCGMVRNLGEPGGGPFIVRDRDGATSLQILESVQLNPNDPATAGLFAAGTHFNPVDLVCSPMNYKGGKFDLTQFVDHQAGFISSKSYEGRNLKALELPGLWNGAMSDWNTQFVDVPLITFNPVKTVLDLLRKEHQG